MRFKEKSPSDLQLDITPLVDTVFNLLIFFSLSLNFIVTPGIKINLPEATTEEIVREREEVIITMKPDGTIYLNHHYVPVDQLFSALTTCAVKNNDAQVVIQADKEVSHGSVVKVMDLSKRAGFTRLAIATSPLRGEELHEAL